MKREIAKAVKNLARPAPDFITRGRAAPHMPKGGRRAALAAYRALPAKLKARFNRRRTRARLDEVGVRW
jgi:hypothetical protein